MKAAKVKLSMPKPNYRWWLMDETPEQTNMATELDGRAKTWLRCSLFLNSVFSLVGIFQLASVWSTWKLLTAIETFAYYLMRNCAQRHRGNEEDNFVFFFSFRPFRWVCHIQIGSYVRSCSPVFRLISLASNFFFEGMLKLICLEVKQPEEKGNK